MGPAGGGAGGGGAESCKWVLLRRLPVLDIWRSHHPVILPSNSEKDSVLGVKGAGGPTLTSF